MIEVNYRLPIFGDAKIIFRRESALLFNWLEKRKEIRRSMNIDQLGVLKRRFSCAHHSKFEYAIMLIHLIEIVQQDPSFKFKYALSRPIEVKNKRIISSVAELLKCWALLLPIGHLHGTFANEKATLKFICLNPKLKLKFLSYFKDLKINKEIEKIINNADYYRLHQIFGVLKLLSIKNTGISRADKMQVNRYLKYLTFYISPQKDVLKKTKHIFADLRRISYILLDSHYCNMLFSFNCSYITQETIKASLLREGNKIYAYDLWRSLDNYLMNELYKNTTSLFIENLAYRALYSRMDLEKQGMNSIKGQLWHPDSSYIDKTFNAYLLKYRINLNRDCDYQEALNLSISGLNLFDIEKHLDRSRKLINRNDTYMNFVVDKNIRRQANEIHLFLKKEKKIKTHPMIIDLLLATLLRFCKLSHRNIERNIPIYIRRSRNYPLVYSYLSEVNNWNRIIPFVLKFIFRSNLEFATISAKNDIHLDAMVATKNLINVLNNKQMKNQEHKDLLNLALQLLEKNKKIKQRVLLIIYPFNVKVRKGKEDKGDIDSIVLSFTRDKDIDIYLLQSKKGMQSYSSAKKQATVIKNMLISKFRRKNISKVFKLSANKKTAVLRVILKK